MIPFKWILLFYQLIGLALGYYDAQQKIISQNGHLILESGLDRNIVIRVNGLGRLRINNFELLDLTMKIISHFVASHDFARTSARLSNLEVQVDRLMNQARILEVGYLNVSTAVNGEDRMQQINFRLEALEHRIDTIFTKLNEDNCRSVPCQNGGTCFDSYDTFQCQCPSNWQGRTCSEDVNECANFAGTGLGCQNRANCINTPGSYMCQCRDNFRGMHCFQKIKDCNSASSFELCGHGICIASNDGYRCLCDAGWKLNSPPFEVPMCVVDINECDSVESHCSVEPRVVCRNLDGSYICGPCPVGYSGNGHYCVDVNECEVNNGGCSRSPSVKCHNTIGSHYCDKCPLGYVGDGRVCIRSSNTCENTNLCHPLARCVEYGSGIINCICRDGFAGNGFGGNGCNAVTGGNGCNSSPCLNGGTCTSTGPNTYICACPVNRKGPDCQRPPNICDSNPCKNGGTCRASYRFPNSTYSCICARGFTGRKCGQNEPQCGGIRNAKTGTIKYPPEGSGNYQSNEICVWLIKTQINKVLNVTFSQFHLEESSECRYDWLQIHDGRSTVARNIGRFCGTQLPLGGNFISTHNLLYLWFRSDTSTSHSGFSLSWDSIDPQCGEVIEINSHGTISSPGSPSNYPINRNCFWYIKAPPGKRLQLHFYTMKIEIHANCSYDFVRVFQGSLPEVGDEDPTTIVHNVPIIAEFCNTTIPGPVTTPTNEVTIYFHSDGVSSDSGFQMHYTVIEGIPGCGGIYTNRKGEFGTPIEGGNYPNGITCEYLIQLPLNSKIKLRFLEVDIETHSNCRFDFVKIYDGDSDQDPIITTLCGQTIPTEIKSSTNKLFLRFKSDWSRQHKGFRAAYEIECGGRYDADSGTVSSPFYPSPYEDDQICNYYIETPLSTAIKLEFIDFDLEAFDSLTIYDGIKSNQTQIGLYSGSSSPPTVRSTTNYLHLEFRSEVSITGRGFKANYSTIDTVCGGVMKSNNGVIRPPENSNGEGYSHSTRCQWIIVAPIGESIQLQFSSFDLESSSSCNYDYLQVFDNSSDHSAEIGKFCGQVTPPAMTSSQNILTLIFQTDSSRNAAGFSATYSFVDTRTMCGGNLFSPSGRIRSPGWPGDYDANKNCQWIIQAPKGQQITLNVLEFSLETHDMCRFDWLEIRNGGSETSPLIGKFCGSQFPNNTIRSFGNKLFLRFVSDISRQGKGFNIEYDSTATGCGGRLTSYQGFVTSPHYPDHYEADTICTWQIIVNAGSSIEMIFTDLDMESLSDCYYDYIEIYDGKDVAGRKLGKFCDPESHPLQIVTNSNLAFLRMKSDGSGNGRGFNIKYRAVCNRTITDTFGVIESPNFPNSYPANINCEWKIQGPKSSKIMIDFSHFNLENVNWAPDECAFDLVTIVQYIDGQQNTTEYCGSQPGNIISLKNVLTIRFKTDSSASGQGFRLEYKIEGCGGLITKPFGNIISPNYPNHYPKNTLCQWQIEAEPDNSIELTIHNLMIEGTRECGLDYLLISTNPVNSTHYLRKICDTLNGTQVITGPRTLYLTFESDSSIAGMGFNATYKFIPLKCGGLFRSANGFIQSPGYPQNYPPNNNCEYLIEVEENHLVELNLMDLNLEGNHNFGYEDDEKCPNDRVMIYDGPSRANNLLLMHCGSQLPNKTKYISSENRMLIVFETDHIEQLTGFKFNYTTSCGATITVNGWGQIQIPFGFKMQAENCTWHLKAADKTQHITFNIGHISGLESLEATKGSSSCKISIEIYDGDNMETPITKRYCGSYNNLRSITSTGQYLTINVRVFEFSFVWVPKFNFIGFYSTYDTACGGEYNILNGEIASPEYPLSYPIDVECTWKISVSPGNTMSLLVPDMNILSSDNNCNEDYLEVRNKDESGELLGVYCGNNPVWNLTSNYGFWIKFRSGTTGVARGFLAHFFYNHHSELTGTEGEITSPLYPEIYHGDSAEHTWRIAVSHKSIISLTFTDLFIDAHKTYCFVKLAIYDGYDKEAPELVSELCGTEIPETIKSTSNMIFIRLQQNRFLFGTKFMLKWKKIGLETNSELDIIKKYDPKCGNQTIWLTNPQKLINFTSPGWPDGYENSLSCNYVIGSNLSNYHTKLTLYQIDLEDSEGCVLDYVQISSSNDLSTWTPLDKKCGTNSNNILAYEGKPYLKIHFESNYYLNKTGYSGLLSLECGNIMGGPSGIISYNSDIFLATRMFYRSNVCMWNITVRVGHTIRYSFNRMNFTSNPPNCGSSLIFKNGIDDSSPLLGQGKYCGTTIPEIPMTISNRGFVKLMSQFNDFVDFELKFEEVGVDCNDNLQLSHNFNQTIVTTPNYPNIPQPHSKCTWTINVPSGEYIKLDFMEFHLIASVDCQTEYVEIRMGTTKNAPLVNRLCGDKPLKLMVKNNVASVTYYTSNDTPHNGFKMKAQIAPCGAIYEGNNGVIASPNYNTGGYAPNMQCEYHVITLPGTYINFTFNYMDWPTYYDYIDEESNCTIKDNIEIFTVEPNDVENSNITYKLQSLGVFCIDTIPPPIITESNEAFIKFTSHGKHDSSDSGWSIQYTASSQKCGGEMSTELDEITSPGYPNNRLNKISCDWYITVPKGRRIKIEIDDLDFVQASFLTQRLIFYNDHTLASRIVLLKGGNTQRIIYTSDNKLRINYWNRTPSKNRGFKLSYSSYEPTVCFGDLNSMDGIIQQLNNETTYVCEYIRTTNFYADSPNVGTLALEFTELKFPARNFQFCLPTASKLTVLIQNNNEIASICENTTITVRLPTPNIKVVSKKNVAYPLMEYKLSYKVHKCGGIISSYGDEIIVRSKPFIQNYGKLDCAWQINFGLGEKIMAHIVNFNFKKSCDKEYMAIYQGGTISDPLIKRYCDSFLFELPLASQTHQLLLEYHTDEYTSESEFEIRFNSTSTACGGFLKHNARILTSPVIASNTIRRYPHNAECIWEIESRTGYHIGLVFTSRFNLEDSVNCSNDYVEVFDYIDSDWKSLGKVCGRNMPTPFNSTSTRMRVIFRSNSDINGDGFTAKWLENCGGTFTASETKKYLTSPGYPDKYQPLLTCNYTIIANASQNINIEFIDFQLEETGNHCSYDNVTLYHYNRYETRSELEMQHTYCGHQTPGIVRINEKLVIEFRTDTFFERPGFRLSYQTESCGGLITEPGKIQTQNLLSDRKYPVRLNCYWNITANGAPNQLKQIIITFDMMELEHSQNCQYDYVEIYKGLEFSGDKRVAKLCGNATGHRFNIESNKGIVHFRSDAPNSLHRFIATVSFTEFCNQKIVLNDELPEKSVPFGEYRSYMNCHYSITAPAGTVIKLTFNSFHVAPCAISQNSNKRCTCDYLEVRDGLTPFSDVIDRYCGDTIPEPIVSSLNSLYIIFVTDGQTNSIGFEMKVKKEVSLCGQTYYNLTSNNQSIEIKSPGGDTYPPNLLCRWTIDSIPFRTIELEFMKFELQEMGDFECSNDMLEIIDSTQKNYIDEGMGTEFVYSGQKKNIQFISFQKGTQHPLYHTEYCGSSIPMNYFSHKNNVEIKFQTDSNIEKSGFTLRARLAHSCERNYTSTQGRIKHEGLDSCTFWIIAPENYTLSLFFIHLYYPETNCTNNGINIYENGPGGKLVLDQCGYSKPNPIFLTTNQVFIESKVLSRTEEYWKNTLMYDIYYLAQTIDQGPGCGGDIYNYGGFFTSPGYPTNHRNNSDCRWNIIVPVHKVVLKFSEFDMGTPSTCGTNFVEIIETDNEGMETVARTFCGGDMPAIYRGLSNKLSVRLEKTVNFAGTGFQIEFFAAAENAEIADW